MSRPDLWDDANAARLVQTELSSVNDDIALFDGLNVKLEDAETLAEMAAEEADE